ncbi:MAG: tetratricopeptide (TPR) repeat protein [Bacteriovoracaceae bacterium]|jgi:tetratricopeptide (TPR) repeat protein
MYEKKPRSRVFAPLAETYRKLGMIDEAMKILNSGIKNHPSYTLGYIVLSHCYYDLQNYEMSYNAIRPFVSQNLENITMQKLFAKTCINLGYLEEALQTFKYLLLLNPKDTNVADQIKLLEDDLLVDQEETEKLEVRNMESSFDEDEWVQVDFNKKEEVVVEDSISQWEVKKDTSPLDLFKQEIQKNTIEVKEHNLDDEFFHEEFDISGNDVIGADDEVDTPRKKDTPLITHTLVDLYCKQGHYAKAASILENILELHPEDEASIARLDEITMKLVGDVIKDTDDVTDEEVELSENDFVEVEIPIKQSVKDFVTSVMEDTESEILEQQNNLKLIADKKIEKIQSMFKQYQKKLNQISKERLSRV